MQIGGDLFFSDNNVEANYLYIESKYMNNTMKIKLKIGILRDLPIDEKIQILLKSPILLKYIKWLIMAIK